MSRTQPWWNPFQPMEQEDDPLITAVKEAKRDEAVRRSADLLASELSALRDEVAADAEAPTRHAFETLRASHRQLEILVELLVKENKRLEHMLYQLAWSVKRDFEHTPARVIPAKTIEESWTVVVKDDLGLD